MNRALALLLVLLLLSACSSDDEDTLPEPVQKAIARAEQADPRAAQRKVLVLGFDACDPELVDDLIRRGKLPNFARLRREGAFGPLRSITPLLSPVVWTTIATGMPPERHGVLDFVTQVPGPNGTPTQVPVSSKVRQADTFWELVARTGDPVSVVGWLVTFPADPLPDSTIVTDRVGQLAFEYGKARATDEPGLTYPDELLTEIRKHKVTIDDLTVDDVRPFANVTEDEYAEAYADTFSARNLLGNLRLTVATAETFRNVGLDLHRTRDPRLTAVYFEAMDALKHYFMPYAPPRMDHIDEETFERFQSAIEANYVWHDRVLGEFMDQCDEHTTLVLVSDHGFKSGEFRLTESSLFHERSGARWHREYGVIFLWGDGVKPGTRLKGASVYDVAPTILGSMALPVPEDMAGRVLTEAFDPPLHVETVPTWFGDQRRRRLVEEELGAEDDGGPTAADEETMQRLQSLGYVGGDRSDPSSTGLNLGGRFLATGRLRQALEAFETVRDEAQAEGRPPPPAVWLQLAHTHLRLGNLEEARANVERAFESGPPDIGPFLMRARIATAEDDLDAAQRDLEAAIALGKRQPAPFLALSDVFELRMQQARDAGDAAAAEGYRRAAVESLSRALQLEPRGFTALKDSARLLLESRDPRHLAANAQEALQLLDRALELLPTSPDALNNRTIALLRLGMNHQGSGRGREANAALEEALASADRALEARPDYAKAFANKAYVLWTLGRLREAHEAAVAARRVEADYRFDARFTSELERAGLPLPEAAPAAE